MFRSNFCGQITNVVNFFLRIKIDYPAMFEVLASGERMRDVVVDVVACAGVAVESSFRSCACGRSERGEQ